MVRILNIETATTNCSVSLSNQGETIVLKEDYNSSYSHAERLHVYIDQVLKEANITVNELDAVAISKGPGSYTGLRIGVSSAKGLCYAANMPLISIATLEALAHQVKTEEEGIIIPMLDARRMEVYSAVFNANYSQIRETQAQILEANVFDDYLEDNKVYFIGSGVEKAKEIINHPNAIFIEGKLPSANEMSILSYKKYKKSDIEDVAYFEPYYLKDFISIKSKKQ
jgi:tRNA threonylcarbamoyladenosine biosynthesis protein TsaB